MKEELEPVDLGKLEDKASDMEKLQPDEFYQIAHKKGWTDEEVRVEATKELERVKSLNMPNNKTIREIVRNEVEMMWIWVGENQPTGKDFEVDYMKEFESVLNKTLHSTLLTQLEEIEENAPVLPPESKEYSQGWVDCNEEWLATINNYKSALKEKKDKLNK